MYLLTAKQHIQEITNRLTEFINGMHISSS